MKHLLVLVLALVLGIAGCGTSGKTPVKSPDSLHSHIGQSTVGLVRFVQVDEDNPESLEVFVYCTGVWVSETEILTAGHCVAHDDNADPVDAKIYYVVQKEVQEVQEDPAALHLAKVKAWDEEHDLALIKADVRGVPPHEVASFASEMPAVGDHVFVVGHPKGMYWTFAEGTVAAYRNETSIGKAVQVNATVWFGNSGGGVFDSSGDLVGICSRLTRVPQMNYYVHLDSVKKFVKEGKSPDPLAPKQDEEQKK